MAGGKDPELRLGLVLYGGVALAVYIYGVVVEMQRLLRASGQFESAGPDNSGVELKGYAKALREGGLSRASVDIISGTSAGGINGVLLAKALAEGGDVEKVRDLWIEGGDIAGLLHHLDDPDADSLLSTEVMEKQLARGFSRLGEGGGAIADGPLDLFVSSTHLRGDRRQFRDSLGARIDTLKHRYVFQLKRRPRYLPPRDDFAARPSGGEAGPNAHLVKLSRATSAFPIAFEPVEIVQEDGVLGPQDEPSAWFADGGILNNKPFTEALETIFTRSSDRPVRRWLLSVDPDPKPIDRPPAPGPKPAFDQIAASAVAQIPRYQSIARDLEALEEHNLAVRRVDAMVADLERDLSGAEPLGGDLSPAYRRLRLRAWAEEIADRLLLAARPSRTDRFSPRVAHRAFVEAALQALRDAGWESEDWLLFPDLAFELRRAYYLIKLIGMSVDPPDGGGGEPGPAGLDATKVAVWSAFESIDRALWKGLSADPLPLDLGDDRTSLDHQGFAQGERRIATALASFKAARADAAGALTAAVEGVSIWLRTPAPWMPDEAVMFEVRLDLVAQAFSSRDDRLLPIEAGGGLRHRDLVEHAQISPATATGLGIAAEDKLAGDTAGHFGGFLDETWRKNDLLWGRLDAAEILVGAIMAGATPEEREAVLEGIREEIAKAEMPGEPWGPGGDWLTYLKEHTIGDVDASRLPKERIESLKTRAGFVFRGMLRKAAEDAVLAEETGTEGKAEGAEERGNVRLRVLAGVDGILRRLGRLAYPYVLILRRRARKSEPPPD